jgi:hypothetical protein
LEDFGSARAHGWRGIAREKIALSKSIDYRMFSSKNSFGFSERAPIHARSVEERNPADKGQKKRGMPVSRLAAPSVATCGRLNR